LFGNVSRGTSDLFGDSSVPFAPMQIARPRLLVASLAIAVVVIGVLIAVQATDDVGTGDEPDVVLSDPTGGVVTYPSDGLVNDQVSGDALPAVVLTDREGNDVPTTDLIGTPLVMNFWFTTCPPCAKELPDFAEVHAEVGDEVRFIGVNMVDAVPTMERFAEERGVQYELYRDELAELTDAIGAVSFPVTIFVGSDGTIVEQTGVLDAAQLRDKVDHLLEADAA
jgi:peroxiredoxin